MKQSKLIKIIRTMPNVKIDCDNVQPMVLMPQKMVHYIFFSINGKHYVYSETEYSYVLSTMKNNNEKMLCETKSESTMVKYFQNYDFNKQKSCNDKREKKVMKRLKYIFAWLLGLGFLIGIVCGLFTLCNYKRNRVINNPPNITEIEEMLENDLLDKIIQVDKIVKENNTLIVYAQANGLYYKCVLRVEPGQLISFYWDCVKVVQVSQEYYLGEIEK